MSTKNTGGEGGAVITNPTVFKNQTFHPLMAKLRGVCNVANNWSAIQPIFDELGTTVDGFLDEIAD